MYIYDREGEKFKIHPGQSYANFYIQDWRRLVNRNRVPDPSKNAEQQFPYTCQEVIPPPAHSNSDKYTSVRFKTSDDLRGCDSIAEVKIGFLKIAYDEKEHVSGKCYNWQTGKDFALKVVKGFNFEYRGITLRLRNGIGLTGRKLSRPQKIDNKPTSYLPANSCIRVSRFRLVKSDARQDANFPYNIVVIGKQISCT